MPSSTTESTAIQANLLPTGVLPAVPMVTACRTQGQIAVTYVCIIQVYSQF